VPPGLAELADACRGAPVIYLGSTGTHGRRGEIVLRWRVLVNLSPEALGEEVRR
jgi:ribosomal protein L35AE/L33A